MVSSSTARPSFDVLSQRDERLAEPREGLSWIRRCRRHHGRLRVRSCASASTITAFVRADALESTSSLARDRCAAGDAQLVATDQQIGHERIDVGD